MNREEEEGPSEPGGDFRCISHYVRRFVQRRMKPHSGHHQGRRKREFSALI